MFAGLFKSREQSADAANWEGYEKAHGNALIRLEDYKTTRKEDARKLLEKELQAKQKKVAYALNLCTVSLSQIVDYQDVNVLQQEYDSILNNLNMEKIEKDDALLKALKQILDTCHFYLLHAKDKEILKKKQAARLKGALGKALGGGNVLAIFGKPSPWAIAAGVLALAGTAAVRYKSERDKAKLENEIEEWELEKSALEQLHNLRRTLFETAWRLAEKYKFPDRYRLTEKQIKVYNDILSEPDSLNRFERLNLIRDNFEAYPLFWYYLGRAALETANACKPTTTEERKDTPGVVRYGEGNEMGYKHYMAQAKDALSHFIEAHEGNEILREDLISASAYLDYASLCESPVDVLTYVDKAKAISGMDMEINQLCAFRYLALYDEFSKTQDVERQKVTYEAAERCLRFLMNEGFNPELNGKVLSKLYLQNEKDADKYNLLKACVSRRCSYVYSWILPKDEVSLKADLERYFNGEGFVNTVFKYVYGRTRLIYGEFFQAVAQARAGNDLQPIRTLKEDKKWATDDEQTLEVFKKSGLSEKDPIFGLRAMTWFDDAKDAEKKDEPKSVEVSAPAAIASLIAPLKNECVESEYAYIHALECFVDGTSERKWISAGLYRHNADYCASVVDGWMKEIEDGLIALASNIAVKFAQKFAGKYKDDLVGKVLSPDSDEKNEEPFAIRIVKHLEKESELMRVQIQESIDGGMFRYPKPILGEIRQMQENAVAAGNLLCTAVATAVKISPTLGLAYRAVKVAGKFVGDK